MELRLPLYCRVTFLPYTSASGESTPQVSLAIRHRGAATGKQVATCTRCLGPHNTPLLAECLLQKAPKSSQEHMYCTENHRYPSSDSCPRCIHFCVPPAAALSKKQHGKSTLASAVSLKQFRVCILAHVRALARVADVRHPHRLEGTGCNHEEKEEGSHTIESISTNEEGAHTHTHTHTNKRTNKTRTNGTHRRHQRSEASLFEKPIVRRGAGARWSYLQSES